jgi:hypothetical protein
MPMFQVGDVIQRCIEDMWFTAVIESVNLTRRMLKVRYTDDGNIEENVPMADCRQQLAAEAKESYESKGGNESKWGEEGKLGIAVGKNETLKKPLLGLIEDDSHVREASVPVVVVHHTADTEDAIVLHGEENRMAAGGGLRALRFLKDTGRS